MLWGHEVDSLLYSNVYQHHVNIFLKKLKFMLSASNLSFVEKLLELC